MTCPFPSFEALSAVPPTSTSPSGASSHSVVLKALSQYSEMTVTVAFVYMPLISIHPFLLFITLSYVDQQIQCSMIFNWCVYVCACVRAGMA